MKKFFLTFTILLLILMPITLSAYKLEVDYPTITDISPATGLVDYIRYIYLFAMGTVGLAAFGAMVYGGFLYMVSGANIPSKGEATKWFKGAIGGLLLALASYLILSTINPALVKIEAPKLPTTKLPENITILQLGDSCDPNTPPLCSYGLECINNKCISITIPQVGQTCITNGVPCAQGLKCENNICVTYTLKEREPCQENQFPRCETGLNCLGGICSKIETTCNFVYPQGKDCNDYYKESGWTTHDSYSAITKWCNPPATQLQPGMVCCCKNSAH